jgi:hypothetical protein
VSEEAVALAAIAAVTAQGAQAYDLDEVPGLNGNPGTLPNRFVQVSVTRRFGGNFRGDAMPTMRLYRVATRAVALNVTDARRLRGRGPDRSR